MNLENIDEGNYGDSKEKELEKVPDKQKILSKEDRLTIKLSIEMINSINKDIEIARLKREYLELHLGLLETKSKSLVDINKSLIESISIKMELDTFDWSFDSKTGAIIENEK